MRFIQAAVSDEKHTTYTTFAFMQGLTLTQLIETAVDEYIKRREENSKEVKETKEGS